ncbi:MAG: CopG family transcriptional regulator [Bacillota bacterium]|jgi:putative iron-only hydrogenase system regulator|nr:CopG family transcriptional regulator [Bacillota bacterium]HHU42898.1 CopG family transcriptional regulator [Clostridiales bacterium]
MTRIGVIGIVVEGDRTVSIELQKILSDFNQIIIGRMGVPDQSSDISAISLIVKGKNEEINALSGRIGRLRNVKVKSALTSVEIQGGNE